MPEETAPDLDIFMLSHQIAYASLQMRANLSNDSIGINHTSSSHTINHSFFNKVISISAKTRGTNDVVFIVVQFCLSGIKKYCRRPYLTFVLIKYSLLSPINDNYAIIIKLILAVTNNNVKVNKILLSRSRNSFKLSHCRTESSSILMNQS